MSDDNRADLLKSLEELFSQDSDSESEDESFQVAVTPWSDEVAGIMLALKETDDLTQVERLIRKLETLQARFEIKEQPIVTALINALGLISGFAMRYPEIENLRQYSDEILAGLREIRRLAQQFNSDIRDDYYQVMTTRCEQWWKIALQTEIANRQQSGNQF